MIQLHHPVYEMCIQDVKNIISKICDSYYPWTDLPLDSKICFLPVPTSPGAIEKQWHFYEFMGRERNMLICFMKRKEMKLSNTSNLFSLSRDNYSLLLSLSVDPTVFLFSPFSFLTCFYIRDLIFIYFIQTFVDTSLLCA